VPRKVTREDERPRRRRGARTAAIEAGAERGLLLRILLQHPKDVVAGAIAFAAVTAIIANALFLQAGRHPSPMFGSVVTMPAAPLAQASPLPRPRPVEADVSVGETKLAEPRLVEPRPFELRLAEPKPVDPLANLVKATTSAAPVATSAIPRPPVPVPLATHNDAGSLAASTRRVAAVQRTLTEYGYGQLKPTGTVGSDTQAAIQKFEREHKIPVTGQMSDRLVRELVAMIGHPID
jgi:Putative peptidoglycan binding domain